MHATSGDMVLTPPRVLFRSLVIGRFRSFRFISFHTFRHFVIVLQFSKLCLPQTVLNHDGASATFWSHNALPNPSLLPSRSSRPSRTLPCLVEIVLRRNIDRRGCGNRSGPG